MVTAIGVHQGGAPSGYVSIYKNVSGRWPQIGKDIVGEPTGNFPGWNISLFNNGVTVAIAGYNNHKEKRYAYIRIYQNRSNTWIQQGAGINDLPGFNTIGLGNDGTITFIGAYENDSDKKAQTPNISYVRMYRFKESSNTWRQTQI